MVQSLLTLHRSLLKDELINAFKDPVILQYEIDINVIAHSGNIEEGKGLGMIKDVLLLESV